MANKTLNITNNGTGTLTLGGVTIGNSNIATYNSSNKKISIVGAGTTNAAINLNYIKGSISKNFNRNFNIKGSKSQLQTLQEEYNAACAAIEEVQNWFKDNGAYYNMSCGLPNNTNIIYGSKPTYTVVPVGYLNVQYTANTCFILYTDMYDKTTDIEAGDYCGNGYADVFYCKIMTFMFNARYSNSYRLQRLTADTEACEGSYYYPHIENDTDITSSISGGAVFKGVYDKLTNHRNIVTIYNELQAAMSGS